MGNSAPVQVQTQTPAQTPPIQTQIFTDESDSLRILSLEDFNEIKNNKTIISVNGLDKRQILNNLQNKNLHNNKEINDRISNMILYYKNHDFGYNYVNDIDCLCHNDLNICIINNDAGLMRKKFVKPPFFYGSTYYPAK